MRKVECKFLWVLCAMVLISSAAWGQAARGTLTGTVLDQSGARVPAAQVSLTNLATNARWKSVSSDSGVFAFHELPPGTYDLTINVAGFQNYVQKGITITVGQTVTFNPTLQL